MGLDMYLDRIVSVYRPYPREARSDKYDRAVAFAQEMGVPPVSGNLEYVKVSTEAAYWRKANAVHQWFVDNVQNGVDDCNSYDVDASELEALAAACAEALAAPERAGEILPPQEGFFFGSTDVDEYYLDDLRQTIKQIDRLRGPDGAVRTDCSYSYHASW